MMIMMMYALSSLPGCYVAFVHVLAISNMCRLWEVKPKKKKRKKKLFLVGGDCLVMLFVRVQSILSTVALAPTNPPPPRGPPQTYLYTGTERKRLGRI